MSEGRSVDDDAVRLLWPSAELLGEYAAALRRGWSPDTLRAEAAQEELDEIAAKPAAFLAEQVDREGAGPPVTLPDGTKAVRLIERFTTPGEYGEREALRFRIDLP